MSCPRASVFDLASGRIELKAAVELQRHVAACAVCAHALQAAQEMTNQAAAWPPVAGNGMESRVWESLLPVVQTQSALARKRAAWRTLLWLPLTQLTERWTADGWRWTHGSAVALRFWVPRIAFVALVITASIFLTAAEPSPVNLTGSGSTDAAAAEHVQAPPGPQPARDVARNAVLRDRPLQPGRGGESESVPPPRAVLATAARVEAAAPVPRMKGPVQSRPLAAPRHVRGWQHEPVVGAGPAEAGSEALLACGAVIDLGQARATLVENVADGAQVALESGRVVVRVPKLPVGGRLEVRTDETVIRVKGTAFAVDKIAADATVVQVFEGVVEVEPLGLGGAPVAREAIGREIVRLHAGESKRFESAESYLRRQIAEMDEHVSAGKLELARDGAERYLALAGRDGPDSADVQLRLGGILSRTGRRFEAARVYRSVADGEGPVYARQNALAVLAVLYRDSERMDSERATWQEYLVRFPDGLFVREALLRLVEFDCGAAEPDAERARRMLQHRFGQDSLVAAALERCRTR